MKNFVIMIWSVLNKEEKRAIIWVLTLMLLCTCLEMFGLGLLIPIIGNVLDVEKELPFGFLTTFNELNLKTSIIIILFIYTAKNLVILASYWYQNGFLEKVKARMSVHLMNVYMRKPYEFHLEHNSAPLIRNAFTEVGTIVGAGFRPLLILFSEGLIVTGIIGILLIVEPLGMLFVCAFTVLISGIAYIILKKPLYNLGKQRMGNDGLRLKQLQQNIRAVLEIKLNSKEDKFLSDFRTLSLISARNNRIYSTSNQFPRIWFEIIFVLCIATLILIFSKTGISEAETLGAISLIGVAAFRLFPSATRILSALQNIQYGLPSVRMLHDEIINNKKVQDREIIFKQCIELKSLTIKYPGSREPILKNLNLKIKRNEFIGFVGPSGSGKSTLVKLIGGIIRPTKGSIYIDDCLVTGNEDAWLKKIGYVSQDVQLIDETIRENIAFGVSKGEINEEYLQSIVQQAGLGDFISALPEGLDTRVGENGSRVSGGQRQRIGIARALYKKSNLLILDEPTSALDDETEQEVLETIQNLIGKITILIVTHRKKALVNCDHIFSVESGNIIKCN